MTQSALRINQKTLNESHDDRFHRFRLISWWDQARLLHAKVLVIGAGALGNELVKNLALLGVGNLFIADLDRIENSNLSRSVLYRAGDNGQFKAEVAARVAKEIFPEIKVQYFTGNVVYDLGLGVFRWADLVIGGLDNREARLAINRYCWKVNRPWIDGAIEQIQGCARVFVPDGPCYECTMSELDWRQLQQRRSCNLLTRTEMADGKTPTTPTISSIIAGVQCQEAVKILHGLPTIAGRGWIFDGLSTEAYQVVYQRKDDCYSHDLCDRVISLQCCSDKITVGELLAEARAHLGPAAELEIARDMLAELVCPACHFAEPVFASLGKVRAELATCPQCHAARREVKTFYRIRGEEDFLDRTMAEIGIPPFDILIARAENRAVGFELTGDSADVLGPLVSGEEGVAWS